MTLEEKLLIVFVIGFLPSVYIFVKLIETVIFILER